MVTIEVSGPRRVRWAVYQRIRCSIFEAESILYGLALSHPKFVFRIADSFKSPRRV